MARQPPPPPPQQPVLKIKRKLYSEFQIQSPRSCCKPQKERRERYTNGDIACQHWTCSMPVLLRRPRLYSSETEPNCEGW